MEIESPPKYPEFNNPEEYTACREPRSMRGRFKTRSEQRAINRCLAHTSDCRSVCDIPSGAGRLFPYWKSRGLPVHGVDISAPMVEAATRRHRELGLDGTVTQGDAFSLATSLAEPPDLIACVRFLYYFDRDRRIRLMTALAAAARRYLLLQFRSCDTYRGRVSLLREQMDPSDSHLLVHFSSVEDIIADIRAAGLVPLRVEFISEFSDRVYALAAKPDEAARSADTAAVFPRRNRTIAAFLDKLSRVQVTGLSGLLHTDLPARPARAKGRTASAQAGPNSAGTGDA